MQPSQGKSHYSIRLKVPTFPSLAIVQGDDPLEDDEDEYEEEGDEAEEEDLEVCGCKRTFLLGKVATSRVHPTLM